MNLTEFKIRFIIIVEIGFVIWCLQVAHVFFDIWQSGRNLPMTLKNTPSQPRRQFGPGERFQIQMLPCLFKKNILTGCN